VTQGLQAAVALAHLEWMTCALWRGMGMFWAPLGARVLARAGLVLVKGVHERVQGGERKTFDTVVRSRDGQR
jgi:hypothetical protein